MNTFRILMVSSECAPVAKSGGLADAVTALSMQLHADGHDVRVFLPAYPHNLTGTEVGRLRIPTGLAVEEVKIYETTLPDTHLPVYLLSHRWFSSKKGIYGDADESFYGGNARRFALFSYAAVVQEGITGWQPDVIHCHDWPAALTPAYNIHSFDQSGETRPATVLTIHNVGYQGTFPLHVIHYIGLPVTFFPEHAHFRQINFLKVGIENADRITTVSPTYALEMMQPPHSYGLEETLAARRKDLNGILNGVDYEVWNPSGDPFLPAPFDEDSLQRKEICKKQLLREVGLFRSLPAPDDGTSRKPVTRPLIGMITRLAEQKGINELWKRPDGFFHTFAARLDIDFIVLGVGAAWCEEEIRRFAEEHSEGFAAILKFDERWAHLIEGGCDFFLMPSRYEPCGLNQMYSLRYGTLPIARRTGGLSDTIEPYDGAGGGTGFLFDEMSPRGIYAAIREAVSVWNNHPEHIRRMRRRAMKARFSWPNAAAAYTKVYSDALASTGSPESMDHAVKKKNLPPS